MTVQLAGIRSRRLAVDIGNLAQRLGRDFGLGRVAVSIVFVDNRAIHDLNLRFRGRDRPTDVLSFNLPPMPGTQGPRLLGEVYVSRDQARLQAREYGVGYPDELRRLVLHGLLHLVGLTHRQMQPLYRKYL